VGISKMIGLAMPAWSTFCAATSAAESAAGQKQPPADLLSQIVRASDVKPKLSAWGETRQHFQGQALATKGIFIATVLIHPGIHTPSVFAHNTNRQEGSLSHSHAIPNAQAPGFTRPITAISRTGRPS